MSSQISLRRSETLQGFVDRVGPEAQGTQYGWRKQQEQRRASQRSKQDEQRKVSQP